MLLCGSIPNSLKHANAYCTTRFGVALGGGDAGLDGAVLEVDDVLLDDVLGVVVVELAPELTVELESDAGRTLLAAGAALACFGVATAGWIGTFATFLE